MGIFALRCQRDAAGNSRWVARGVYHRALLGLYSSGERMRRIPGRAPPLANSSGPGLTLRCRYREPLRRTVRRTSFCTARFGIYSRRFPDHGAMEILLRRRQRLMFVLFAGFTSRFDGRTPAQTPKSPDAAVSTST